MRFEAAVGTVPVRGLSLKRVRVRELVPSDWPAVSRIYAEGIATRNATFETGVPSWTEWEIGRAHV